MAKSRQTLHEYYANAETARNLWFCGINPNDEHMNYEIEEYEDDND